MLLLLTTAISGKTLIVDAREGFNSFVTKNVAKFRERDGSVGIRLRENRYRVSSGDEMLLRFENGVVRDVTGHYGVFSDNSIKVAGSGHFGRVAPAFFMPSQMIVLNSAYGRMFSNSKDIGSFKIDFWVLPYSNYNGEEIFSKWGNFLDNQGVIKSGGIKCHFNRGRIEWDFKNFFRDDINKYRRIKITTRDRVLVKKWTHVSLSYSHFSGKMIIRINGEEQAVRWVTTGGMAGSPLIPAFHENMVSKIVVGKTFHGRLDELRVVSDPNKVLRINRYDLKVGQVCSDVFDLGDTHATLKKIRWLGSVKAGSAIFMEYRFSDKIFAKDFKNPKWIRIKNGETAFKKTEGQFLQLRFRLLGAQKGKVSPVLSSIKIDYESNTNPLAPTGLQVVSGNNKVKLRWIPNTDKIDGYLVYFGTSNGEYLHPNSPVRIPATNIDLNNPAFVIYGLENDRLYYFAVKSYRTNSKENRSTFSKQVFVRPTILSRIK